MDLKPIIKETVSAFITKPNKLKLTVDTKPTFLCVAECHADDYGLILGNKCEMLVALRTVINQLCLVNDLEPSRTVFELERQPKRDKPKEHPPKYVNPDWTTAELDDEFRKTLAHCFSGKLHTDYDDFTPGIVKMLIVAEEQDVERGFENALELVLNAISSKQGGKRIRACVFYE